MMLIDTHNHIDSPEFDGDREAVLQRSRTAGIHRQIVQGIFADNWSKLHTLADHHDDIYFALGMHPIYLDRHRPEHLDCLEDHLRSPSRHPKLCAIGEIGLDYWVTTLDRTEQKTLFEAQLTLAKRYELPVILHVRRAHADCIAQLKRFKLVSAGTVHAFAGSFEEAREYIKLGFKLGLGGAPTWPQATRLKAVVQRLPLDAIVLETDAPDMPPAMFPDQRNSPEHLPAICRSIADIMGITPEQLAEASSRNACQLYGWSCP